MTARYGRFFPDAAPFRPDDALLIALAETMFEDGDSLQGASSIPAGYTYLGQFIAHDVSFEQGLPGDGPVDPGNVVNLGTPLLDLDSLYGGSPARTPFLYEGDGVRLRVGWSDVAYGEDLPRASAAPGEPRLALIPDPRDDDNLIISQLHLAFIKFHNRVTRVIENQDRLTGRELFQAASTVVRRHYQWMIVHDYLRQMVSDPIFQRVLDQTVSRGWFPAGQSPAIPVEFSAAAFRFGHSMVRRDYMLEPWYSFPFLSTDQGQQDVRGRRERPPKTEITDWSYYFGPDPQFARKIDTVLIEALRELPLDPTRGAPGARLSLPLMDLRKGSRLGLPTGQSAAEAMGLAESERLKPEDFPELRFELEPLARTTPLWYYCLKEAQRFGSGSKLGPVGGRIVADVLVGLLLADPTSYLVKPNWQPEIRFGARVRADYGGGLEFGIRELLAFAASDPS